MLQCGFRGVGWRLLQRPQLPLSPGWLLVVVWSVINKDRDRHAHTDKCTCLQYQLATHTSWHGVATLYSGNEVVSVYEKYETRTTVLQKLSLSELKLVVITQKHPKPIPTSLRIRVMASSSEDEGGGEWSMYSVPRLDEMCLNYVARRISRITPYVCVPCRRTQGTQTEQGHCLTVLLFVVSRSHTAMASHASRVCATDPEGWRHLCGCRNASTSTRAMCRGNYQNQTRNETTDDEGAAH